MSVLYQKTTSKVFRVKNSPLCGRAADYEYLLKTYEAPIYPISQPLTYKGISEKRQMARMAW